jgi:hypothetical protein
MPLLNAGIAIAAITPIMTTTQSSSTKENPFSLEFTIGLVLNII